ncbi:glycosyl transferase [Pseudomonas multiresinivorans]|uniref:Glycosyltransferase family 1 protein n=1 Tax=Pseudomonas multiresinivorans TaxID=95301 RepID=A0A7Z3BI02_9PSED|nr:glycosyl transferase [Pseudomonas multiresinivorans]QJP07251.1 glycosyltransferase family 1 protein [Pseudomonas multiresinivorans]
MNRLVYLSPVPWNSFSQRPHKFAEWFHSATRGEVLWVDPYPTRFPNLADLRKLSAPPAAPLATPVEPWLKVLPARALPIEPIPGSRLLNSLLWRDLLREIRDFSAIEETTLGIGKPSELAIQLLKHGSFTSTIYDAMDDFPAFYSGMSKWAMHHRESIVANRAEHLLASSTVLVNRFANARKATLCMNACAIETLPSVDSLPGRPGERILGYVGTIGPWFDWAMINRLAMCAQVKIRLIGPMFSPPAAALPPNVEMHPQCTHAEAIAAMQGFDVGLIPFKQTELTESVDPIKYYEYRALGLPVLSSHFGEMRNHAQQSGVFILHEGDDEATVSSTVETALEYSCNSEEITSFRNQHSWTARFNSARLL